MKECEIINALDDTEDNAWGEESEISDSNTIKHKCDIRHEDCRRFYDQ